jgi:hypothetical protein
MALIKRFIRYFKDRKNFAIFLKAESFSPLVPLMLLACMFPVVFALIFPLEGDVLAEAKSLAPKLTVEKLHVVDAEVAPKAAPAKSPTGKTELGQLTKERRLIELEWRVLNREASTVNWWLAYVIGFLSIAMTLVLVGFAFLGLGANQRLERLKEEADRAVKEAQDGVK